VLLYNFKQQVPRGCAPFRQECLVDVVIMDTTGLLMLMAALSADDAVGVVDLGKVQLLLHQLVAALRFPSADSNTLCKGLTFLAVVAFLQLPRTVDKAELSRLLTHAAAAEAPGSAAATEPDGSSSVKKSRKKAKIDQQVASVEGDGSMTEQQVVSLAVQMQPGPTQQLRQQCAARLIALLHSLQHRAVAGPGSQQQEQAGVPSNQQQQQKEGESNKQKKARLRAQQERSAAAARHAAWQQQEAATARLLQFVAAAQELTGIELTVSEDVLEMVQQLQQLGASISQYAAAAAAAGSQQKAAGNEQVEDHQQLPADAAAKYRASLHLIQQLQLQLLAGGLSAEAAGSVVDDLEAALVRGLGLPSEDIGIDKAAAAAALHGSDEDEDADDEAEAEEDSSEDGDSPAWQDVLLDLLLSLLSSSSSASGSEAGGSVAAAAAAAAAAAVPSAPMREACEGLFRVFADHMTSQGEVQLLLLGMSCMTGCCCCCLLPRQLAGLPAYLYLCLVPFCHPLSGR
jgi:hypothetical protein